MLSAPMPLLVFLAVFLAMLSVYSLVADLWLRDRSRLNERLDEEFHHRQREQVKKSSLFKNLGQMAAELTSQEEPKPGLRQRLELLLEQAGLSLTLPGLRNATLACALVLGLGAGLARKSPLSGVAGALVGAGLPLLYVQARRASRLKKLRLQLPSAFDTMARVMRAGQTVPQALRAISDEFKPPIAAEFAYCHEQQNLGLSPETAFRDLARRTGLIEIKIFVLALLVQRQTGGNLAELLDKLAVVVRERLRIQDRVRALTAEGRLQAQVLMVLPPLMFVTMLILKRSYVQVLLDRPLLLVAMVALQVVGAIWTYRVSNFRY
jgi:tight adherence protein B